MTRHDITLTLTLTNYCFHVYYYDYYASLLQLALGLGLGLGFGLRFGLGLGLGSRVGFGLGLACCRKVQGSIRVWATVTVRVMVRGNVLLLLSFILLHPLERALCQRNALHSTFGWPSAFVNATAC